MGSRGDLPSGIVTFAFTDIQGSTRVLRRLGDRYSDLLDRHLDLMAEAWSSHGGHVMDTAGDGVFVAFHDANAAVSACADAQRRLCNEPWPPDGELRVRMGVHTGLAAPHGDDYRALAVHQAARVMSAAHGGQVLISAATMERLRRPDGTTLLPLGRYRVRDFEAPVQLFQLGGRGLPTEFPSVRAVPADGHNLVLPPTSFHGRDMELELVCAELRPGCLVTLAGFGGVGKTRMATEIGLRVADAWIDGAWLVDLAPIEDPGLIASAVGDALGVPSRGDDPWTEVLDHLAERQALLIFDNCERLRSDCARLLEELLAACPACGALVTSRAPLATPREHVWRLGPLGVVSTTDAVSPAVALFIDRARAARPGFNPDGSTLRVIAEICQRLDGLPLAIELAAPRLVGISPEELLEGLRDRFRMLRSENPLLPERQRTLDALLGWSDRLLSPGERTCLRRLAVFGASFSVETATAAVAAGDVDSYDVPELVWSLVDKSLVTADLTANATRYRLLESVRDYARERLTEHAEAEETAVRLASWYGEQLGPARRHERRWTDQVSVEIDNLRALIPLIATAAPVLAQELAFAVARHLDDIQSFRQAIAELERHVELLDVPSPAAVSLRTTLADIHLRVGDAPAAEAALKDAEDLLRRVGSLPAWDDVAIERTRGELACRSGDYETARDVATRALAGDLSEPGRARMCNQLGIAAMSLGDIVAAESAFERELEAWRRIGNRRSEASALGNLAEVALRQGIPSLAARRQRDCLALALELGAPAMVAMSLIVASRLLAGEQRWGEATTFHYQAASILDAIGLVLYEDDQRLSDAMLDDARRHLGDGDFRSARAAASAADLPAAAAMADHVLAGSATE
ncbi:MAG: tetratricopeptide repeat protein [Acidimicrobiales bacterium]